VNMPLDLKHGFFLLPIGQFSILNKVSAVKEVLVPCLTAHVPFLRAIGHYVPMGNPWDELIVQPIDLLEMCLRGGSIL
jgi:hypothetical protein